MARYTQSLLYDERFKTMSVNAVNAVSGRSDRGWLRTLAGRLIIDSARRINRNGGYDDN